MTMKKMMTMNTTGMMPAPPLPRLRFLSAAAATCACRAASSGGKFHQLDHAVGAGDDPAAHVAGLEARQDRLADDPPVTASVR